MTASLSDSRVRKQFCVTLAPTVTDQVILGSMLICNVSAKKDSHAVWSCDKKVLFWKPKVSFYQRFMHVYLSLCKSLKHGFLVKRKSKNTKTSFSEFLLRLGVLRVLYCSVCFSVYGPFCHGVLKLDMSTSFTSFFLWTSIQFIFRKNICVCVTWPDHIRVPYFIKAALDWLCFYLLMMNSIIRITSNIFVFYIKSVLAYSQTYLCAWYVL